MEKAQQVKCSLLMIGNIVYGSLIRFEIEVNPIRHGGSGQRNYLFGAPSQEIICLHFFFI